MAQSIAELVNLWSVYEPDDFPSVEAVLVYTAESIDRVYLLDDEGSWDKIMSPGFSIRVRFPDVSTLVVLDLRGDFEVILNEAEQAKFWDDHSDSLEVDNFKTVIPL